MNIDINSYYQKRENIFNSIQESTVVTKTILAFLVACLTGILAQIVIPLPFTPVPITGQTFAVLIAGLLLGKKYGVLSQVIYIGLGATVIPWFSGMTGGFGILFGSTFGYFVGFILAAYFIGSISEKYANLRKFRNMLGIIAVANFFLIYVPGLAGLEAFTYITTGTILSPVELMILGFVPFIIGDVVKIIAASVFSKVFLPK